MLMNGGERKTYTYLSQDLVSCVNLMEISMTYQMAGIIQFIDMPNHYLWGCEYERLFKTL